MIIWETGDLFTCGIPDIAHGVNCAGVMGAGIAVQFRNRYPLMYESYRRRCLKHGGMIPGDVMSWKHDDGRVIFNLATQPLPGPSAQPWMITAAVGRMITEAHHDSGIARVAMPLIGCGIGGLAQGDLFAALSPYQNAPVDIVVVTLPEAR
jgi:O-acetyl-ADP-ribose deacetylase (regulator of RNase III)